MSIGAMKTGLLTPGTVTAPPTLGVVGQQAPEQQGFNYTKGQNLSVDEVNAMLSNKVKWSDYGLQDYNTYGSVDDFSKAATEAAAPKDEFSGMNTVGDRLRVVVPDGKGGLKQYNLKANSAGYAPEFVDGTDEYGQPTRTVSSNPYKVDPTKGFTIVEGGDGGWEWKDAKSWYDAEAEEQAPSGFDQFMEIAIPIVVGAAFGGAAPGVGQSLGISNAAAGALVNGFTGFAMTGNAKGALLGAAGGYVGGAVSGSQTVVDAVGKTGAKIIGGAASGLLSSGGKWQGAVAGAAGSGVANAIGGDVGGAVGGVTKAYVGMSLAPNSAPTATKQTTPTTTKPVKNTIGGMNTLFANLATGD